MSKACAATSADVEALICRMRREHPRWGARRISYELANHGLDQVPSRATVHRVLTRNGLIDPQAQQHKRSTNAGSAKRRCICGNSTSSEGCPNTRKLTRRPRFNGAGRHGMCCAPSCTPRS